MNFRPISVFAVLFLLVLIFGCEKLSLSIPGTNGGLGSTPFPVSTPNPTPNPTAGPTPRPTAVPTAIPTQPPGSTPLPTPLPTAVPTAAPTALPTAVPTAIPTPLPTPVPTAPSTCPTGPQTCILLTWTASTSPNVGYHIWYGTSSGNYTVEKDAGTALTYQLTGMAPGTYYIAATAYDLTGTAPDSAYSNEVSPVIPLTTIQDIENKYHEEFLQEKSITIPPRN
jgi:hypothetical protein